jgi:dolichyl-phosphate beta-glucosyltransferase
MQLSVVIPCFNEARRLGPALERIARHLRERGIEHEIIVVDDGSTDGTRSVAAGFPSVALTSARGNRGKGYSVREGVLRARGDLVLVTDADLSTPIEELDRFLVLAETFDIVIGSRAMPDSLVTTTWYRRLLGRTGHALIVLCAVRGIRDTQCGFKLYRQAAARALFSRQTLERFGFDFEILHLAQRAGMRIREEPVRWVNSPQSHVRWYDYPRTLLELARVAWNRHRGDYEDP